MLPSILAFAMARCSISSAVSGPSFSKAGKISDTLIDISRGNNHGPKNLDQNTIKLWTCTNFNADNMQPQRKLKSVNFHLRHRLPCTIFHTV